jgi:hypothetical protein
MARDAGKVWIDGKLVLPDDYLNGSGRILETPIIILARKLSAFTSSYFAFMKWTNASPNKSSASVDVHTRT